MEITFAMMNLLFGLKPFSRAFAKERRLFDNHPTDMKAINNNAGLTNRNVYWFLYWVLIQIRKSTKSNIRREIKKCCVPIPVNDKTTPVMNAGRIRMKGAELKMFILQK